MASLISSGRLVRFEAFEFDRHTLELRKHGLKIKLSGQPIEVLAMLLARPGELVTREELQKRLWPHDTIVEFEHSINAAVKTLRRALGDSADKPRYIETLARRGYRFIAQVEPHHALTPSSERREPNGDSPPGTPSPERRVPKGNSPPGSGGGQGEVVIGAIHGSPPRASPEVPAASEPPSPEAPSENRVEETFTDLVGRTVSRYRVLARIGGGAMGVIYKAEDTRLGRTVALKFLPAELAQDPQALARFQREARAASVLNHPNICTVYDTDEHAGQSFIAMELLEGETLKDRLTVGARHGVPLQINALLDLAIQIAAGLEAAHGKGIIHRDIKPANIFLTTHGQAKILDFGVAKLTLGADIASPRPANGSALQETATLSIDLEHLTIPGSPIGTAAYMSPEQVRGEALDTRTDIFSFGAVLYEMATGRQAFAGKTSSEIQQAILRQQPVSPKSLEPDLPPKLEEIINRALEKDRELRYQHASEMRAELQRLKRGTESGRSAGVSPAVGAGLVPALIQSEPVPEGRPRGAPLRWKVLVPAALILVAAAIGGALYFRSRQSTTRLTDKDTIVLSDFDNKTGEPIWDDTLKQALTVALRQSPFLNVLSDSQVATTLRLMEIPPGTAVTGEVAREVCQRAGSRAYIAGSIAALGSQYVLGLKAVACAGGEILTEEQATAAGKENVVNTVGAEATKLREELGESLASVQQFDTPLAQATTSSLEALRAFTFGVKARRELSDPEAIPFYKRAIELDPDFAMAHEQLGDCYFFHGEITPGVENFKKAFELRDRVSGPEKLHITLSYYYLAIGDLQKAAEVAKLYIATYPRDIGPYTGLGRIYARLSQYESAVSYTRQAIAIYPDDAIANENLMWIYIALDRLDQARAVYEQAKTHGLNSPRFHLPLFVLAFVQHDAPAMEREAASLDNKPGLGDEMLCRRASSEAYYGRFRQARRFTRLAVQSMAHGGLNETAATCLATRALEEALAEETAAAQEDASEVLNRASGRDVETLAAFAFAATGVVTRAQALATDLARHLPLDTLLNSVYLPSLRAALAIRRGDAARALELLEPVRPFDMGLWAVVPMYPAYVRGEAYLRTGQGDKAAEQFQQVLDHRDLVGACPVGALASLGLARAYALEAGAGGMSVPAVRNHGATTGETPVPQQAALAKARADYQDFFTLWKDADPDIPILKQAKAEYARLQ